MKSLMLCLAATLLLGGQSFAAPSAKLERIVVAPDNRGFITAKSKQPFKPWGMNYGNDGRLMEDFWDTDWETFAGDIRELKAMGANVIRMHLQYGKFMESPEKPNAQAIKQLHRMLRLAEETGIYLDLTGLASYRPADIPKWYDAMEEPARWEAQAKFWEIIARECKDSPAVFCYDLINEPLSPGGKRKPGEWRSGSDLGGFDFLQYIALDPAGRKREDIAAAWIKQLSAAIRKHDPQTMITVGMLPWSRQWKHLSGFLPATVAPELSYISVHIYPDSKLIPEAMEGLRQFAVGKPVVIEETFPLSCTVPELEKFLQESKEIACGWIGHYDGLTIEQLDAKERTGKLPFKEAAYRGWLRLFVKLTPEFKK